MSLLVVAFHPLIAGGATGTGATTGGVVVGATTGGIIVGVTNPKSSSYV